MSKVEVLCDWLDTITSRIKDEIFEMPDDVLHWRPDLVGNSIALTVWHIGRSWDILTCHVLRNHTSNHEVWHIKGWSTKTGYDPTGISGYGNLYGYTFEETNEVPRLSNRDLIQYVDETYDVLSVELSKMADEQLLEQFDGDSKYDWISNFVRDGYEHLGEIKALSAMCARRKGGMSIGV